MILSARFVCARCRAPLTVAQALARVAWPDICRACAREVKRHIVAIERASGWRRHPRSWDARLDRAERRALTLTQGEKNHA